MKRGEGADAKTSWYSAAYGRLTRRDFFLRVDLCPCSLASGYLLPESESCFVFVFSLVPFFCQSVSFSAILLIHPTPVEHHSIYT